MVIKMKRIEGTEAAVGMDKDLVEVINKIRFWSCTGVSCDNCIFDLQNVGCLGPALGERMREGGIV